MIQQWAIIYLFIYLFIEQISIVAQLTHGWLQLTKFKLTPTPSFFWVQKIMFWILQVSAANIFRSKASDVPLNTFTHSELLLSEFTGLSSTEVREKGSLSVPSAYQFKQDILPAIEHRTLEESYNGLFHSLWPSAYISG